MPIPRLGIAIVVLLSLPSLPQPSSAATLESFTLAAGGFAIGPTGCGSFAAPAPIQQFFGPLGIFIPSGGLSACTVQGSLLDQFSATGPLSDARTLDATWNGDAVLDTARTRAEYGFVQSRARVLFTGPASALNVVGAEAASWCTDELTFTSPTVAVGQTATVVLKLLAKGHLGTTGTGTADVELATSVNGNPAVRIFRAEVDAPGQTPTVITPAGTSLAGLTVVPGDLNGSVEVTTQPIAIVLGTPLSLRLGLLSFALPVLGSQIDAAWSAALSGLTLTRTGGAPIADFVVSAGSGSHYGASGVLAVGDGSSPSHAGSLRLLRNPSHAGAEVRCEPGGPGACQLSICDLSGRVLRTFTLAPSGAVAQTFHWDGRDAAGAPMPSGVYFARLSGRANPSAERFVMLR